MRTEFKNLKDWYDKLKSNRDEYKPVWEEISKYVGIRVDTNFSDTAHIEKGKILDYFVDDPTACISVNQTGDYLQGVCWGTGSESLQIEPSDELLEVVDKANVDDYFAFVTNRVLSQMNHSEAGLNTALKPYFYDQVAFGTSGVGAFPNPNFGKTQTNALIFRSYGIDNIVIDEGANGLINVIFVTYNWRISRIVSEFAFTDGNLSEELFAKLPKEIQEAYKSNDINKEVSIIQAVYPREDFDPMLKGKKGARYRGDWFMDNDAETVFFSEDFKRFPIGVCRAIRIRGEVYGRSSGSILISTIKSVDYMVGKTIEILEKMESPALGTWNNAVFGDSVLDTSADGLVVFNQANSPEGSPPVFKLQDIGDPTGIISFLIPYLNEKVATAFKTDILLDFNSAKEMTATESLQRFVIRGKSLAGLLQQQKVEMLEPLTHRCISILEGLGLLGVNAVLDKLRAKALRNMNRADVIIPDAVLDFKLKGKPWYKIKFNNELEKLSRTEKIEQITQTLNFLTAMAGLFPAILEGVEWYKMWKDINEYLGVSYSIGEKEFKEMMRQKAEMQRQMMMLQAGQAGAEIQKNSGQALKSQAEAGEIKSGRKA